jgi:hypothetical protein
MTNLNKEMMTLLTDGREYRVAFVREDGGFDIADRFMALDDAGANAYAETYFAGQEWYVLDARGRNINGGAA